MNKLGGFKVCFSLSIGHMAGMIDLAALPLWIGTLMQHYRFPPEQAGLTTTTFLGAVMAASCFLAPRFHRLHHRGVACCGFVLATLAFFLASWLTIGHDAFPTLLLLHALAGLGAGAGLSVTHGLMGRTTNPHRLFGIANMTMGFLAIIMFAVLPGLIGHFGGQVLFVALASTMAFASVSALAFLPSLKQGEADTVAVYRSEPFPPVVWPIIGAVICLALNQAMVFAFVERLGVARGFGERSVQLVLVVMGFINLMPGLLAAALQKRLSALNVGIAAVLLQAAFALSLTSTQLFPFYAAPLALFVSLVIFTHVFMFGLLSRVEPSGRAVAATPAMMMIGSAVGPVLGGTIVAGVGYRGLGWAAAVIAAVALMLILIARRKLSIVNETPALAGA